MDKRGGVSFAMFGLKKFFFMRRSFMKCVIRGFGIRFEKKNNNFEAINCSNCIVNVKDYLGSHVQSINVCLHIGYAFLFDSIRLVISDILRERFGMELLKKVI
jgi:hypothetical protein